VNKEEKDLMEFELIKENVQLRQYIRMLENKIDYLTKRVNESLSEGVPVTLTKPDRNTKKISLTDIKPKHGTDKKSDLDWKIHDSVDIILQALKEEDHPILCR